MRIDCARWLLPVAAAPIEDGALATRKGQVLAAGPRRAILKNFAGAAYDHGEAAILPGLVNCHAHLELGPLAGKVSGEGFCGWLGSLIEQKAACSMEALRDGVRRGLAEARGFGTALVADVVSACVPGRGLYGPGRAVALVELLGLAPDLAESRWAQASAAADLLRSEGLAAAIAPHSPYTVSGALLRRCAAQPLVSVHVAESVEEVEFLRSGKSALRNLLTWRGAWDESFRPPGLSPVAYLDRLELLGETTLAVHLVQATAKELELLARRGAAACICPRSNAATGVGEAPLAAMLGAGLRVCLGTDSLASSEDLNLFREAAAAARMGATPEEALRMATLAGAEALGQPELGALAAGRRPQPLVVPVAGRDPVAAVLEAGAQGKARFLFERDA